MNISNIQNIQRQQAAGRTNQMGKKACCFIIFFLVCFFAIPVAGISGNAGLSIAIFFILFIGTFVFIITMACVGIKRQLEMQGAIQNQTNAILQNVEGAAIQGQYNASYQQPQPVPVVQPVQPYQSQPAYQPQPQPSYQPQQPSYNLAPAAPVYVPTTEPASYGYQPQVSYGV
ncbi:hypothetical protein PCE1_003864 [Barthelona sp. PCE]